MTDEAKEQRINELKDQLLVAYKRYDRVNSQTPELSCGVHLTEYIHPDLAVAREGVNKILRELRTLDPLAPKDDL